MNENRAPHRRDLSRREFVQGSALAGLRRLPGRVREGGHLRCAVDRRVGGRAAASRRFRGAERVRRSDPGAVDGCRAELGQLDLLHGCRRGDRQVPDARAVQGEVRDDGQLQGGDRRQRHLHRDDQAAARGRPGHGLGPHHGHRLDGRPADPARLGRDDGPRQHAERHGQPAGRLPRRHVGSDQRPPRPVAVGDDRARLRPGQDRRPHQPRRVLRPQVQGQHRVPDRDARHDRPDDAQARARPGERRRRPTATPRSPRSRRSRTRA